MKYHILIFLIGSLVLKINSQFGNYFHRAFFIEYFHTRPEVCAEAGCVRGIYERGLTKTYEAFYGIPYAAAPVEELRFENPEPHPGWYGYWDASYPRDSCPQRNTYIASQPVFGSEDCLYLNIYRPLDRKTEKLPVLVYIHGGNYFSFSADPSFIGPEYIMDNGEVILVTLNYRLGILGFLCSGDEAVKGNFGLKDQQMALQWVAYNIEYFGGDPDSITLSGHNAGAASTHLHMMNPVSKNLFHRAILMSGSAIAPGAFYSEDYEYQFRLTAKNAGLENADRASTFELALDLKTLDVENFIEATDKSFIFYGIPTAPFRPCIERYWAGAFLRDDPQKVWIDGRFEPKPILIGFTRDEGAFNAVLTENETMIEEFNQNIYNLLPSQLEFPSKYVSDVIQFFLGKKDYIDQTNVKTYNKMYGDRLIKVPIFNTVKQYLKYADVITNPVYLYEFAFTSPYTLVKISSGNNLYAGVSHFDDMFFLFTASQFFVPFDEDSLERRMSKVYIETLINFATKDVVKVWRHFRPCSIATADPLCDRQVFERSREINWDQILVSVTNNFDLDTAEFWNNLDRKTK